MAGKKSAVRSFSSWPKPVFATVVKTNKNFKSNYGGALMYAHYELSSSDLKKEVVKYFKTKNPKDPMLDRIKDIHENRLAIVGKYIYILNHGGEIPEEIDSGLWPALEKVLIEEEAKAATAANNTDSTTEKNKADKNSIASIVPIITIQDRLREKAREVAGELEGWIDDFFLARKTATPKKVEEFVNLFKGKELKAPHMRHMQNIFERRAAEIAAAAAGKDADLNEGYSNFTKAELKKFDIFHKNLLGACIMMQEVAKVERAPRKKKPVSHDKLVAKLKYKKNDNALGIVSQNPVQIIGSKEVWVYNTKTRKLAQYRALDERGLAVKGTGLINYSSDSVEKTIRKPEETLADFKKASKVKLRTFLKDLTTVDIPAGGKLNEHHIILRIDK